MRAAYLRVLCACLLLVLSTGALVAACSNEGSKPSEPIGTVQGAHTLARGKKYCDFDGDGRCDLATWRPSTGIWRVTKSSNGATVTQQWGAIEDIPVPGDYDGDETTDYAIWRPSSKTFAVIRSLDGGQPTEILGSPEDTPVPGDYDKDGKTDYAVWNPGSGVWTVKLSTTATIITRQWGSPEDIPVPGDYDNDGQTDFAVWRPSSGNWLVIWSSTNTAQPARQWGAPEDIPTPADFDNDGKTDFATWRPSMRRFAIVNSSTGQSPPAVLVGQQHDIPVPRDYNNDDKADFATWSPTTGDWDVIVNGGTMTPLGTHLASAEDIPIPILPRFRQMRRGTADYDGDGKTDIGVRNLESASWSIRQSSNGSTTEGFTGGTQDAPVNGDFDGDGTSDHASWDPSTGNWSMRLSATETVSTVQWGAHFDLPVPADFNGDRKTDIVVYRPGTPSTWLFHNGSPSVPWGEVEDIPVPADYDGDGKADVAYWRPSTGNFSVRRSSNGLTMQGISGTAVDVPVPADYDGDGRADFATWSLASGRWTITKSSDGTTTTQQWGASEDIPIPGDFDGDGKADIATWRPSTRNFASLNGFVSRVWGNADTNLPLPLPIPVWPWHFRPVALTALPVPTTTNSTDLVNTASSFWEFSALASPPGAVGGCPSTGRTFLSGTTSAAATLYRSTPNCTASTCVEETVSTLPLGVSNDAFEADSVMARLPNGTLLLARGVMRQGPIQRSGTGVWNSTDCGSTWNGPIFIDPSDKLRYPPPEFPGVPSANYGDPQRAGGAPIPGGWDREELYADPFNGNAYLTVLGRGGLPPGGGNGALYEDPLLIRSTSSGWQSIPVPRAWPPMMMTSVPGRLFILTCQGSPYLHWSDNNGVSIAGSARLSWRRCDDLRWETADGSSSDSNGLAIGRVSWTTHPGGPSDAILRVVFPGQRTDDGSQVARVLNVTVTAAGVVTSRFVTTISSPNRDVVQTTLVEPDVSQNGLTTQNASILYWTALSRLGASTQSAALQGVLLKNELGVSPIFPISTNASGQLRTWPSTSKTSDYGKGSFLYTANDTVLRYFIPWIEVRSDGVRELRRKIYSVPK
jgi:hypothetical protein